MPITIVTLESQPFAENSYVLHLPGRTDAVVVDPGFEPDLIFEYLDDHGLSLAAILNTHGHVDHIAGNAAMKKAFPDASIAIGRGDANMLTDAMANLSGPFGMPITSPPADRLLDAGDVVEFAGMTFDVRFTPGHSPGHVVFVVRESDPVMVIGGDVLFRSGVGRTDFPGGSFAQLAESIRSQLYSLPDPTVVYPGHGPVTTIGHEKKTNPFVSP
jgi:glyoxylase-like metal-dependent hydrolase (beta-lactamase superfamily II)